MSRLLYSNFAWVTNLGWMILDLMPELIRRSVFKTMMKDFGKGSYFDYRTYIRYMKQLSVGADVWINRGCKFFLSNAHKYANII
jgi:hypothetical protein